MSQWSKVGSILGRRLGAETRSRRGSLVENFIGRRYQKSDIGYVAKTQLIACLSMLTIDQCVTRNGDLLVACHSGRARTGEADQRGRGGCSRFGTWIERHPQPVFAWPASETEVRVEFDRPVQPEMLHEVLATAKLTAGVHVRAGDRVRRSGRATRWWRRRRMRRDARWRSIPRVYARWADASAGDRSACGGGALCTDVAGHGAADAQARMKDRNAGKRRRLIWTTTSMESKWTGGPQVVAPVERLVAAYRFKGRDGNSPSAVPHTMRCGRR